jgi:phosphoesterase RecJ-like protein
MPINWTPFVEMVHTHQRFLLTTHVRPDADGLGSLLALAEVLENLGKQVQMVNASKWPPRYTFLDPERRIEHFTLPGDAWREAQAVMVLDTGTWGQLGDFGAFLRSSPASRLVIDHHVSQDDLGGVALVDTSAEATGRLMVEAIQALGQPLPPKAANNLFAALATDTGWFRHSNTTAATFALAEQLMRAGAQPTILYEHLYEQNPLPRLKLTGLVLDRLQVTAGGLVAFTEVQRADYAATGAWPQDTEDLINFCRSLAGVEVAIFFMEQPAGGVKVSFRSRTKVDVAKLAEQWGGGGHRRASGTIIQGTLTEAKAKVLAAVERALKESAGS